MNRREPIELSPEELFEVPVGKSGFTGCWLLP